MQQKQERMVMQSKTPRCWSNPRASVADRRTRIIGVGGDGFQLKADLSLMTFWRQEVVCLKLSRHTLSILARIGDIYFLRYPDIPYGLQASNQYFFVDERLDVHTRFWTGKSFSRIE